MSACAFPAGLAIPVRAHLDGRMVGSARTSRCAIMVSSSIDASIVPMSGSHWPCGLESCAFKSCLITDSGGRCFRFLYCARSGRPSCG